MIELRTRFKDVIDALRGEAAEARRLAATFRDSRTLADLHGYAAELEAEANQLESDARDTDARDTYAHHRGAA